MYTNRQVRLFREAVARLVHHDRRIRDLVLKYADFYMGQRDAEKPPRHLQLDRLLNPTYNGADYELTSFGDAAKYFCRGEYPQRALNVLYRSSVRLHDHVIEPILRSESFNVSFTVVTDFYNYLSTPSALTTAAEHEQKIDEFIARLKKRFCQNSDSCYNLVTKLLKPKKAKSVGRNHRSVRKPQRKPPRKTVSVLQYRARGRISLARAAALTGFARSTIQRLSLAPKGTHFPGLDVDEKVFLAWALSYKLEKVRKHWANMANHPIRAADLPDYIRDKLGM